MTKLAAEIYQILRKRVPAKKPEISYTELVEQLEGKNKSLPPDSPILAAALGEIVVACRKQGLPAISAIVVRFRERIPGPGYYPAAHPDEAGDVPRAMIAWAHELEKVRATSYPTELQWVSHE